MRVSNSSRFVRQAKLVYWTEGLANKVQAYVSE